MEKMVVIDGKEVRFRNSASMLTIYKAQTGRDLLSDFQKMQEAARKSKSVDFDSETLCAIAWSMARCADKTVPSLDEWLDQFEMWLLHLFKLTATNLMIYLNICCISLSGTG